MINYYKILGVSKTATIGQIKAAYRDLAKEHHPDKGGDPEKFKEISLAYEVLSNPEKKIKYDNGEDPTQHRPGIKAMAQALIIKTFNDILNTSMRRVEFETSVLKGIKGAISSLISKLRNDGEKYKEAINFYQQRMGIISKQGDNRNIFDMFMLDNIRVIKRQRGKVAEEIKVCRESIRMLKEYRDKESARGFASITMATGTGTSSFS